MQDAQESVQDIRASGQAGGGVVVSKHRDRGVNQTGPFGYVGASGDLFRVKYYPYGVLHRAEYGLSARKVRFGYPFE